MTATVDQIEPNPAGHPSEDPRRRLAGGSLRFLGAVGISVGIQAPTGGLVFIPALMAGIVGSSGPLAFLVALLAMLPVAYVFGAFSREYASAGSAYTFTGDNISPTFGFATAFLLLLVYILYFSATVAGTANNAQALLTANGVHISWLIPAVVAWLLASYLMFRSIHLSSLLIVVLEGLSLVVVLVVGVIVIAKGGHAHHGVSAGPFRSHGLPIQTLILGLVFAYTGFSGFEGAATVGEEVRLPRRVIPAAIMTSLVVGGAAYTFGSFVETIAYPSGTALAKADVPMVTVAHNLISPWVGTLINVAALVSIFGACLATSNGAARLLFALTRDGFLHDGLAVTHPKHRSPYRSGIVVAVLAGIGFLVLAGKDPLTVFFDTAQLGVYLILVVYLFTCLAGLIFAVRRRRRLLAVIASVGIAVLGVVIKYSINPLPAFPFDWLLLAAGVVVVLSFAIPLASGGFRRRLGTSPLFRLARAETE
jgi:amino acid transporter